MEKELDWEDVKTLKRKVREMPTEALHYMLEAAKAEEEAIETNIEVFRLREDKENEAKALRALSWSKNRRSIIAKEIARRIREEVEKLDI